MKNSAYFTSINILFSAAPIFLNGAILLLNKNDLHSNNSSLRHNAEFAKNIIAVALASSVLSTTAASTLTILKANGNNSGLISKASIAFNVISWVSVLASAAAYSQEFEMTC